MNRNRRSKTTLSKSVGLGRNRKVSHDEKVEMVRSNAEQRNLATNSADDYEEYMFLGVPVKTKKSQQYANRTTFTNTDNSRPQIQERSNGNNFDSRDCNEEQNEESEGEYEEYMFLGVPIKTKKIKEPPKTTDKKRNNPESLDTKLESRDTNDNEKEGDNQEDIVEPHEENDLNSEGKEKETNEEEDQSVETVVTDKDKIAENERNNSSERNEENDEHIKNDVNDQNECNEELDQSLTNRDDDQDISNEEKDRGVENEQNDHDQNEQNNYFQSEQQKDQNEAVSRSTIIPRTAEYNHDVISTQENPNDTSFTNRDNTIAEQVKEEDDMIMKIGDSIMGWFAASGSTAKSQTTVTRSAIDKSNNSDLSNQTQEQNGTVIPSERSNRDNDKLLPSEACSTTSGTVPDKTGENDKQLPSDSCLASGTVPEETGESDKQLSSEPCLRTRDTVPDINMYDFVTEKSVESDQMYSYSLTDSILTQMKSVSSLIEGDPEEYLNRFHSPTVIQDSSRKKPYLLNNNVYTSYRDIDFKKDAEKSEEKNRILELETRIKRMEEARIEAEVEARLKAKALQEEEAKAKAREEARMKDEMESQVNNLFLGGVSSYNDGEEVSRLRSNEEEVSRLRKTEEARIQAEAYARLIAIEKARSQAEAELRVIAAEKARIKAEEETRVKLNTRDATTKSSNNDGKTKKSWMSRFRRSKKPPNDDVIENERSPSPDVESGTNNNLTAKSSNDTPRQDNTLSMFFGPDKQNIGKILSRSSSELFKALSIDSTPPGNDNDFKSTQLSRSGSNLEANRSFTRQPSIVSNVKSRSFGSVRGTVKEEMDETDGTDYEEDLATHLPDEARNYIKLEHLRPFSVFLGIGQTNAFTVEIEGDILFERIKHNLKFFYLNYMLTTAVLFVLTLLIYPGAIIGMAALGIVWLAVLRCMSRVGDDKIVSQKPIMIIMSGISSLVLFFLLKDIFWWALGLALVVIAHHAVFRNASMYSLEEDDSNDYVDFDERDEDESFNSNYNGDRLV